jgi:aspartate racemase
VENDDFTGLADALNDLMGVLHRAGADLAIIPSNTMHVVFDEVAKRSPVPLLNIAAVAGDYCRGRGFRRIGIMGTAATIRRRLLDPYLREGDALPVYPSPADQEVLGTIIAQELVRGIFKPASINLLLGIASRLRENADAIILGCTELPLVITRENCDAPLIDTTRLLAHAAPDVALHPSDLLSRGS